MNQRKLLGLFFALTAFGLLLITPQLETTLMWIVIVIIIGVNSFFAWRLWTRG